MVVPSRVNDRPAPGAGLEYARELWRRRKWVALVVFAAVISAAGSISLSLPNLYRATATVLVETQHVSEEFVRPAVSAALETRIQAIREEVMSRTRLYDLMTRFDLYPELRAKGVAPDAIIERMRKDIELELDTVSPTGGRAPTPPFAVPVRRNDPPPPAPGAHAPPAPLPLSDDKTTRGQAGTSPA